MVREPGWPTCVYVARSEGEDLRSDRTRAHACAVCGSVGGSAATLRVHVIGRELPCNNEHPAPTHLDACIRRLPNRPRMHPANLIANGTKGKPRFHEWATPFTTAHLHSGSPPGWPACAAGSSQWFDRSHLPGRTLGALAARAAPLSPPGALFLAGEAAGEALAAGLGGAGRCLPALAARPPFALFEGVAPVASSLSSAIS